jgi:hypothetical protein
VGIVPNQSLELGGLLDTLSHADQVALQEIEAIRLILNYGTRELEGMTLMGYILQEVVEIEFTSEPAATAMKAIQHLLSLGITPGPEQLLTHQDPKVRSFAQDLVMPKELPSPRWLDKGVKIEELGPKLTEAAYRHLCLLNLRIIRKQLDELKPTLLNAENDEIAEGIVRRYLELKSVETHICKELGIAVIL